MSVGKKKFNYGQITTNLSTEMGAVAYNAERFEKAHRFVRIVSVMALSANRMLLGASAHVVASVVLTKRTEKVGCVG